MGRGRPRRARAEDALTFGTGTVAAFFAAARDRGVDDPHESPVTALLTGEDGTTVTGVRVDTPDGPVALEGRRRPRDGLARLGSTR